MAITRQQWADWVHSSITQAVIQHLEERKNAAIEGMLNLNGDTAEEFGLKHLAYRSVLSGMGEFLDLDSLAESVGVVTDED